MGFDPISVAVGSGLNLLGGFLGRDDRRQEADHAADRSDAMAREEMAFQERMSNSAYQRARSDMEKAGINPMLAVQNGGASTPSGAMGSAPLAQATDVFGRAVSGAMDMMRLQNETKAQGSQQALNDAMSTKALADAGASGASSKQMQASTKALESQMEAIAARAKADKVQSDYDYKAGTYDALMKRLNPALNSAKSAKDLLNPMNGLNLEKYFYGSKKTGEIFNP